MRCAGTLYMVIYQEHLAMKNFLFLAAFIALSGVWVGSDMILGEDSVTRFLNTLPLGRAMTAKIVLLQNRWDLVEGNPVGVYRVFYLRSAE